MTTVRSNGSGGSEGLKWDGAVDWTPRSHSPSTSGNTASTDVHRKEPERLPGVRFHLANRTATSAEDRDTALRWNAVSAESRSQSPVTVPGYAGHVPGKGPASNCGLRFPVANHVAAGGTKNPDPLERSNADEPRSLSPIPGYAGHMHGSRPEAVFGLTFQAAGEAAAGRRPAMRRERYPVPVPGYSGCAPVQRFDPADVACQRIVAGVRLSTDEQRRGVAAAATESRPCSRDPVASECSVVARPHSQDFDQSTRVRPVATPTRIGGRSSPLRTGSEVSEFSEVSSQKVSERSKGTTHSSGSRGLSERSKGTTHNSGSRGRSPSPRERLLSSPPCSPVFRDGLAIPGYTGYVPMKKAEAVFGARFRAANDLAVVGATTTIDQVEHCGIYSRKSRSQSPERDPGHIPGYCGHLPRKRGVYGEGFSVANDCALAGKEVDKKTAWNSSHTTAVCSAIAGYTGHIPSKRAEHVYGKTFQVANACGAAKHESLRSRKAGKHSSSEQQLLHVEPKTVAHNLPAAGQAQGVHAAARTRQVSIEWTSRKG